MQQCVTTKNTTPHEAAVVLHRSPAGAVLVIGGIGSGKTSLLYQYAKWAAEHQYASIVVTGESDLHWGQMKPDRTTVVRAYTWMELWKVLNDTGQIMSWYDSIDKPPNILIDNVQMFTREDHRRDHYNEMIHLAGKAGAHLVVTLGVVTNVLRNSGVPTSIFGRAWIRPNLDWDIIYLPGRRR